MLKKLNSHSLSNVKFSVDFGNVPHSFSNIVQLTFYSKEIVKDVD